MDLTNQKNGKPKRKSSIDLNTMIYGKIPPQARPMEEAILGGIMSERWCMDAVLEVFQDPAIFYVEAHGHIFQAMLNLNRKNKAIDELTVVEELKRLEFLENVGGPSYVSKLTSNVVSTAGITDHCRIVFQKHLAREVIRMSGELIGEAYEDFTDSFELLENAEKQLYSLVNSTPRSSYSSIDSGLVKVIKKLETLRLQDRHITGIPSGFRNIDQITHGWQDTDLIILAARPSVGKTAFALNLLRNAVFNDIKPVGVGFFSLEMSEEQLIQRIISAESEIFLEKISTGRMDDSDMQQLYETAIQKLANAPIFIDDTPALNIFELRAKARRMKRKNNIGLVIIDYLQLMSGTDERKGANREQEISKISRDLKQLAKELKIPIIALSQLSRDIEKRKGDTKQPQLSDLRESGAIEQDADLVTFMYRLEADEEEQITGEIFFSIAKHRNGTLAKGKYAIRLVSKLEIQKFYNSELLPAQAALPAGNWRPVKDITEGIKKDLPF
jgi:replicative DNA helicase